MSDETQNAGQETTGFDATTPLYFNGINGDTGSYFTPSLTAQQLAGIIAGTQTLAEVQMEREEQSRLKDKQVASTGMPSTAQDHRDLTQTGWGVILPHGIDLAIKEALKPLLDYRREQATASGNDTFYRELTYRPGESAYQFLERYKVGPGIVDPAKGVPYYLLIVGSPQEIPYRFQTQLDVQFGVGRIWFEHPTDYARYARSVVAAEERRFTLTPRATFFGVANEDDPATSLSSTHLVQPLAQTVQQKSGEWTEGSALAGHTWDVTRLLANDACREDITRLLHQDSPALLFSACHGMGFSNGNPRQMPHQGALLCQDWPGPRRWTGGQIPSDFYFSADDLGNDAAIAGMIAFFFACYGAGTPKMDEFAHRSSKREAIAPHDFLARLPLRMLAHPAGGALAVIGHVERAWGTSFMWGRAGQQLQVFEHAFKWLLSGYPVGYAFEQFNLRYAEIAANLSSELENIKWGEPSMTETDLVGWWTANNDARGYVIIGDPAVHLPVAAAPGGARRLAEPATINTPPPPPPPPPETPPRPATPPPADVGSQSYGWLGGDSEREKQVEEAREGLVGAITEVAGKLGTALKSAIDDAATLEVATYVSHDLDGVVYDTEQRKFSGKVRLRALTRINIDGDTLLCLPENEDGEIDRELWEIHREMVERAQSNRNELLKTALSAATGLLDSLKVL